MGVGGNHQPLGEIGLHGENYFGDGALDLRRTAILMAREIFVTELGFNHVEVLLLLLIEKILVSQTQRIAEDGAVGIARRELYAIAVAHPARVFEDMAVEIGVEAALAIVTAVGAAFSHAVPIQHLEVAPMAQPIVAL